MRPTLVLMMALAAAAAAAQTTRRQACELLSVADVEAAIGVSPLRSFDQQKTGKHCRFEKAGNQLFFFEIFVEYVDPPDADAVTKWLKVMDTKTYNKARPAAGIGDAAYYTELFGNPSQPKTLTVFVAGTMQLQLGPAASDQPLRALAEKALGGTGRTGFAYNGMVPTTSRPESPSPKATASSSPLDELKSALTRKADAGDVRAEEALAGLYRFGAGGGSSATKPDFAAAMYWYKRASDHGVARASYQLATMYRDGIGGPVNDDAAQALFTQAADSGYVPAMLPLAFLYASKPDFVSKRRAAAWALKAADADDPEGHLVAGYLWDKGLLSFDDAESGRNALVEYRKASDRGNCTAMMNAGGLYFNGSHGLTQDAAQAQAWFDRAQACFGKGFQDLRQKATRYRALAAAGHLPVPETPPPPPPGSRYFDRGGRPLSTLEQVAAAVVGLTALSAAYLIAHPEVASQLSGPREAGDGNVNCSSSDYGYNDLQNDMHNAQVQQQVWSGGCKPPVGCF